MADLHVEVSTFSVAQSFTKEFDKAKVSRAMAAAAEDALKKTKLTVAKKSATTKNFTLIGALTVKEKGSGAAVSVSLQLNRLDGSKETLYGMGSGSAETDKLRLIEDAAVGAVESGVAKAISVALKKAAAEK